jgi:hypothetical protein
MKSQLRFLPSLRSRLSHLSLRLPTLSEIAPLAIPLALTPWVWRCAAQYFEAPLFSDVGMFRYSAWCLLHGQRLYRDIVTPDGPLIHFLHAILQLATGSSEKRFRVADFLIHASAGEVIGWLLAPPSARTLATKGVWALFGGAVWLSWSLALDWTETGQREDFYAAGGLTGMALLYAASDAPLRRARWMLPLGGALVGSPALGKHSGVVYLLLGLLTVALGRVADAPSRWRRTALTAAGAAAAMLVLLLGVAVWGDLKGWVFWYFRYPFAVYLHFARWRTLDLFSEMDPIYVHCAALSFFAGGVAVARGLLPRKAAGLVLAPLGLYLTGLVQAKGWRYQFVPTVFAAHVLLVLGASAACELADPGEPARVGDMDGDGKRSAGGGLRGQSIAWAALFLVGVHCFELLEVSPWVKKRDLSSRPELADMRKAAGIVQGLTRPGDRVFYYGDDSHMLLLAGRLPANTYHAQYVRHFREALADTSGNPREHAEVESVKERLVADVCGRIERAHPAAFVFADNGNNAYDDVMGICPQVRELLAADYVLQDTVGANKIFVSKKTR